ncbi:YeeE/YedE family protein [Roseomonas eburnea]|uniref:YeeE/YedE family protein n=1 Tax=Neoroseomonas eburnea TaxID=1346889 RepID=A0A9X9XFL8_9PROT|nr:YeeE/YedE family protein [Neoroseomonas eburnea]MBR0682504.1 YeeE/YedE family protein [Neoroseomonas eburnea]
MSDIAAPLQAPRLAAPSPTLAVALALLLAGTFAVQQAAGGRLAVLFLLGAALGLVLYHASFGFTAAWRVFAADRRGAGLRAQMAMLAFAVVLFFPALAAGSLFGQPVAGFVSPVGLHIVVGAFLFGLGMQLGGGCASGTLFALGGGSVRMAVVLAFFIVGSVAGAAHLPFWVSLANAGPVSLIATFGLWPALTGHLAVFAAIAGLTVVLERRRHGALERAAEPPRRGWARLLRGPWPLMAGALGLAVLNFATLAIAGRPWGITSAFALWGSKVADAAGMDVAFWSYWSSPAQQAALEGSVLADITSVMDIGIVVGAFLAASLAGKIRPEWRIPARSLAAAVIGGLLMGYGARLAFGCNIGAYFSGIASASLHAWVWLPAAFLGSAAGTRLRPRFGLAVERTPRGAC